ncbi:hypothetical protein ACIPL1_27405 [Pseudomonas sp. NPDC090202]|uniref:hypothetical protein n=1 Tax=Pseudomonas sp. NPDC090202 TaxID=3364476 RepID=UPI00382FA16A
MELTPLQRSAEYDDIESQLKALFLRLYQKHLAASVQELGLSGMPNLASDETISRHLNNDGLAILRDTSNENIRYLFHAWRYRNPQRGTAFLRTYLTALFGPVFTIEQLWCPKDGVYPQDARDSYEMSVLGVDKSTHFRTSRLRVDIETNKLPDQIIRAAKTAIPARMVLEMRVASRIGFNLPVTLVAHGLTLNRMTSIPRYVQRQISAIDGLAAPMAYGRATVVRSRATPVGYSPKVVLAQSAVARPLGSGQVTIVRSRGGD